MKKLLLITLSCTIGLHAKSQNTFPASGNVGIGTISPFSNASLQVKVGTNQNIGFQPSVSTSGLQLNAYTDNGSYNVPLEFRASLFSFGVGNVGIGTNNPGVLYNEKLTVSGSTNVLSGNIMYLSNPNNTNAAGLKATSTSGSNTADLNIYGGAGVGTGIFIQNGGNVGVGTITPFSNARLQVKVGANQNIGFQPSVSTSGLQLNAYTDDGSYNVPLELRASLFSFGVGNVGIGTSTPDQKLSVAGTIHSQAVKVDMNGWSDYVFNHSYNLSSLENVSAFIDKNHHLPDMPSEKEVIKNGVDLGEMLKLQQKKIEELTLYLIEKDKQIQSLQKGYKRLNKKLQKITM